MWGGSERIVSLVRPARWVSSSWRLTWDQCESGYTQEEGAASLSLFHWDEYTDNYQQVSQRPNTEFIV